MYFSTFIQWSTMQPLEKRSISLSTNMELRLRILLKENSKVQIIVVVYSHFCKNKTSKIHVCFHMHRLSLQVHTRILVIPEEMNLLCRKQRWDDNFFITLYPSVNFEFCPIIYCAYVISF